MTWQGHTNLINSYAQFNQMNYMSVFKEFIPGLLTSKQPVVDLIDLITLFTYSKKIVFFF